MTTDSVTKVYLAGELFDAKHLAGNALLANELEKASEGRYSVLLPQDLEIESGEAKAIRDADYTALLECDAAVFQFDGSDLDSGTVAEFLVAKFADKPSVTMRTDFRKGGDRNRLPWNLMCSFFPRTEDLVIDSMERYASARGTESVEPIDAIGALYREMALQLKGKLDQVISSRAIDGAMPEEWLKKSLGLT